MHFAGGEGKMELNYQEPPDKFASMLECIFPFQGIMSDDFSASGECGLYIAQESFRKVLIAIALPVRNVKTYLVLWYTKALTYL